MEDRRISLPAGWIWSKLEGIINTLRDGTHNPPARVEEGIPLLSARNIKEGFIDWAEDYSFITQNAFNDMQKNNPIKEGNILLTIVGTIGRSSVVKIKNPFAVQRSVAIINPCDEGVIPLYLQHYFNSSYFRNILAVNAKGTAQKGVYLKTLKGLDVPLAPIHEQYRIVAKIEELFTKLDAGVEALQKVKAQLKQYRQAVLKHAFEGKLTEEWREANKDIEPASVLLEKIREERKKELGKKYMEPHPIDTSDLPELPEGWVWTDGYTMFSFITSGSRGWAKYYSDSGINFIRMGNLTNDSILLNLSDIQKVKLPPKVEGKRTRVCTGDILISITADVGRVAVVPEELPESYINQHVALARPGKDVNQYYVAWYLMSMGGQRQLKKMQRGATKTGLGLDDIRTVKIPMPSLEEQGVIVAEVERHYSIADGIEGIIIEITKRSERLRQSILKRAFEGKLVPQDPSDEPAEKLLERIQEEKLKQKPVKKSRKKQLELM